ncbi:flagellar protein FlgN [Cognatilysobacter terrigena]|uniref:flagellar protein FlgN n=1 Tax=Cognatilysobacter terrigena TaxID=2488749 RepID=UPI001FEAAD65|nr:flagellar protein FlgN [Lysobacter terrigena]
MLAAAFNAPSTHVGEALDALERALQEERQALLENDADALLRSTQAKIAALRRAETMQPGHADATRVSALSELNRANGILLARRRREVSWALRHMGRVESSGVYDAGGQAGVRPQSRCLGVG